MKDNDLPSINRYITDHNNEGKAIFNRDTPETLPWQILSDKVRFGLGYVTNKTPVDFSDGKDVKTYQNYLTDLPGIMVHGGTVLRIVDMPPGCASAMHRTVSLDYGVVLEGKVDLILDSGEVRRMNRGDVSIQRGTNHQWRNVSGEDWARILYVLQESEPILVEGKALEEDYGGIPDTKPSKDR